MTPKDFTGNPSPPNIWSPGAPVQNEVSDLPNWLNGSEDWKVHSLAETPHAAHPYASPMLFSILR